MTFEQAAGLFITYPTSYEGLVGRAEAKKGEWVLVHAGAGGVGLAAVQIAKGEFRSSFPQCLDGSNDVDLIDGNSSRV
jgi:NADPH:quinone reductase-like Zn-dependent oxidoreductase